MSATAEPHRPCPPSCPSRGRVLDPVCGMTVDPKTAKHKAEHNGQSYYFCSAGCKTKFTADPEKYLAKQHDPITATTTPAPPPIRCAA